MSIQTAGQEGEKDAAKAPELVMVKWKDDNNLKTFHLGRGRSADVPYFAERKRPFEDHPGEPALAQETRLGRCHIAHLRRSTNRLLYTHIVHKLWH